MLKRKSFTIIKSKNISNSFGHKVMKGAFKDSKWVLRDIEFIEHDKRVILVKNSLSDEGDKYITDESII